MIHVNLARYLDVNKVSVDRVSQKDSFFAEHRVALVVSLAAAVVLGCVGVTLAMLHQREERNAILDEEFAQASQRKEKAVKEAEAKARRAALPRGLTLAAERGSALEAWRLVTTAPMQGIGLKNIAVRGGGLYYVSGVADDPRSLSQYEGALRVRSEDVRKGEETPLGASKRARAFSRYGRAKHDLREAPFCDELFPAVDSLETRLRALAGKSGVKLGKVAKEGEKPLGGCVERAVSFEARGAFDQVDLFLHSLDGKKSPVGIAEVRVGDEGGKGVVARVRLDVRYR